MKQNEKLNSLFADCRSTTEHQQVNTNTKTPTKQNPETTGSHSHIIKVQNLNLQVKEVALF